MDRKRSERKKLRDEEGNKVVIEKIKEKENKMYKEDKVDAENRVEECLLPLCFFFINFFSSSDLFPSSFLFSVSTNVTLSSRTL